MAGNAPIEREGGDYDIFYSALTALNTVMAKKIAADGEGASRLIECTVTGAKDVYTARTLAKSVISSNLVKAAMFGRDANWGRVLCALGYSGAEFTAEKTSVYFSSAPGARSSSDPSECDTVGGAAEGSRKIAVFENGVPLNFDEALAKKILGEKEVEILVELQDGKAEGRAWGCDLTYDYVKINSDYRT